MWEWDNKAMMEAISLHDRVMRMHLAKFGGYEVATEGDAFLIAFHTSGNAVAYAASTQPGRCLPPPPPPPAIAFSCATVQAHQVSDMYLMFLYVMCIFACRYRWVCMQTLV